MLEPITLKRSVASNTNTNPDDILALKTFLNSRGYYAKPDWGLTPYPDDALFAAIEAFQRANHLKIDGKVKPDGETLDAIHADVRAKAQELQSMGRNGDTLLAHITPAEATLLDRMTDGGSINPKTGLLEFFTDTQRANEAQANRSIGKQARGLRDQIDRHFGRGKYGPDRETGGGNDNNAAAEKAAADAKAAKEAKDKADAEAKAKAEQERQQKAQEDRAAAEQEQREKALRAKAAQEDDEDKKNTGVLAENEKPTSNERSQSASPKASQTSGLATTDAERAAERNRLAQKAPGRTFSTSQIDASIRAAKAQKAQAASIQAAAKAQKEKASVHTATENGSSKTGTTPSSSFATTQEERDKERERLAQKAPGRTFAESAIDASIRARKAQQAQAADIQAAVKEQHIKGLASRMKAENPDTKIPDSAWIAAAQTKIAQKKEAPAIQAAAAEQKAKSTPQKKDGDVKWQLSGQLPQTAGVEIYRTPGPIKVEFSTQTLGFDAIDYNVKWHPLDKNGKIDPNVQMPEDVQENYANTSLFMSGSETVISPPFDHPFGWEVEINIRPQPDFNANAGQKLLQVRVPDNQ